LRLSCCEGDDVINSQADLFQNDLFGMVSKPADHIRDDLETVQEKHIKNQVNEITLLSLRYPFAQD